MKVVTSWDILEGNEVPKHKVAIIGAGSVGIETAEYIGSLGSNAFIVELSDKVLNGEKVSNFEMMMNNLNKYKIDILTSHKLISIEDTFIIVEDKGEFKEIECDMVVVAIGAKPNKLLAVGLDNEGIEYHLIGDCKCDKGRLIGDAVRDGFNVSLKI